MYINFQGGSRNLSSALVPQYNKQSERKEKGSCHEICCVEQINKTSLQQFLKAQKINKLNSVN